MAQTTVRAQQPYTMQVAYVSHSMLHSQRPLHHWVLLPQLAVVLLPLPFAIHDLLHTEFCKLSSTKVRTSVSLSLICIVNDASALVAHSATLPPSQKNRRQMTLYQCDSNYEYDTRLKLSVAEPVVM